MKTHTTGRFVKQTTFTVDPEFLKYLSELYDAISDFLYLIMRDYPDTTRLLYQKWFRSDPPCLGTQFRGLIHK